MRFSCKKCSAQYTIADEKIRGKVIKVRCKRCNYLLVVRDEGVSASRATRSAATARARTSSLEQEFEDAFGGLVDDKKSPGAPAAPALKPPNVDEQEWYCGLDGAEEGPLSLRQMVDGLRSGQITEDHFVWREGMGDWLPIEEVPELAGMLDGGGDEGDRRRQAEAEKKRQAEADKKRRAEAEKKRQAEAEKKRQAEAEKKRQAEAEKRRQAEAEKRRQAEAEKKRQAEAEKKRQAEAEKKRQAEAEKKRQAEAEKKRQAAEQEKKKAKKKDKKKAKQKKDERKDEKKAAREQGAGGKPGGLEADLEDPDRKELLARVLKKRAAVRVDRHAGRIAEHFFVDEDEAFERNEVLPPPPVEDGEDDLGAADVADQLEQESLEDERLLLQVDPMAVVEKRKKMGEISEVIARQAGVGSEKKRLGIGLLVVVLFVLAVGGLVALAFSQGWFGSNPFASRSGPSDQEGFGPGNSDVDYGDLSPEEAARIRSSIWNIEPKKRGQRSGGHNGVRGRPAANGQRAPKSKMEKDLMAFYHQQDEAKSEATPRLPRGAPEGMVAGIQFPTGVPGSVDMSMPGMAKTEVVPEQRETVADSQKLTSVQIRLVIRRNARRVKKCFEKQLKRDPNVSGKLLVTARVQPSGKITKVGVGPEKFHGTYLEECLTKEVLRWRFPSFKGEPYDLTFPYALSARQTY